jgi:hypothetical protein
MLNILNVLRMLAFPPAHKSGAWEGTFMGLVLKYVQEPTKARDQYRYRGRVPEELKPYTGKGELIAALGGSKVEALKAYPRIREGFERELKLARKALKADQSKRPLSRSSAVASKEM